MFQDLRFAVRMIGFRPWFSAAIVAVLAFGIGANAAVFTLVNAVLFKALPYKGGDRIVAIFNNNLSKAQDRLPISYPDYLEYRRQATSFESLEASWSIARPMSDQNNPPEPYNIAVVTPSLFSTLGVQPMLGRAFTPDDAEPDAPAVVLIGYSVWRDRYGSQSEVIGHPVRIDKQPATIVGVMPKGFGFPNNYQLWMPLGGTIGGLPDFRQRSEKNLMLIGIRKPGVSISQSRADLSRIAKGLAAQFPEDQGSDAVVLTFHRLQNDGPIRLVFILMQAAVAVVLLIACANVANMMLSRALGRTREMSIRASLGASRWHILRQLLTESVLLSALGGILGLALSRYAVRAFDLAVANAGKPSWILFEMDYTVFAYCAGVCLFSGLLFGLAPGLQASRVDLNHALKDGVRTSGSRRGRILSGSLVVLQFTFAVVLLATAGMFLRGFFTQRSMSNALPLDQVLTARIQLPDDRYPDGDSRYRFYDRLVADLKTASGVRQAAIASAPPGGGGITTQFQIEGEPEVEPSQRRTTLRVAASPGYLPLVDVPVLSGRDFNELDGTPGRDSIIVTADFAARSWPGQPALGKRLRLYSDTVPNALPNAPSSNASPGRWLTVVGVAGNLEQQPAQMNPLPVLFTPYRPGGIPVMNVFLRDANNPTLLTSVLRAEMRRIDPERALGNVQTLAERADQQGWYLRVFGTVFLIFALIALSMASIGIYAVVAHNTGLRTREIGIRMALGASARGVLRLVMSGGMKQLLAGLLLGLAAALSVTRLMGELLFRVSPTDPVVFGTVVLVLTTVGAIACYLPARRAAAMHPVKALRHD